MTTTRLPTGRHRIAPANLTPAQDRFVLGYALERLGTADGLVEDAPAIPYAKHDERLAVSGLAAWMLGLALTPDAEIAQCYDCADIIDGALAEEDAGIIRCVDCHSDHNADEDTAPDSYDVWADFYRT